MNKKCCMGVCKMDRGEFEPDCRDMADMEAASLAASEALVMKLHREINGLKPRASRAAAALGRGPPRQQPTQQRPKEQEASGSEASSSGSEGEEPCKKQSGWPAKGHACLYGCLPFMPACMWLYPS